MSLPESNFVSIDWLNRHLDDPNIVILDATIKKMPNGELVNQKPEYVKGAQEFNYDTEICDQDSSLPHMLPTAKAFEAASRARGICRDTLVVCYDAVGMMAAPRAWWMFKVMGHDRVVALDGGLAAWMDAKLPTQTQFSEAPRAGDFQAGFRPEMVYSVEQVLESIGDDEIQTIDARSMGRFTAEEPEPRSGLRGGHIPGSSCIPFPTLLENGVFKDKNQLKTLFENVFDQNSKRRVFSCGSGITACSLALAADECGYDNLTVYDGSWTEWGGRIDLPIET